MKKIGMNGLMHYIVNVFENGLSLIGVINMKKKKQNSAL